MTTSSPELAKPQTSQANTPGALQTPEGTSPWHVPGTGRLLGGTHGCPRSGGSSTHGRGEGTGGSVGAERGAGEGGEGRGGISF